MTRRALLIPLAAASLLASCVTFRWDHENRFVPIADSVIASFEPGRDDLDTVLEKCGGPLYVYEQTSAAFGIAYGWFNGRNAGATFSVPTGTGVDASLSYDNQAEKLFGVVFLFDAETRLQVVKRGFLRDIAPGLIERRPSFDPRWEEQKSAGG